MQSVEAARARILAALAATPPETVALAEDSTLEGGDTLVLSGRPAGLALAEEKLLK